MLSGSKRAVRAVTQKELTGLMNSMSRMSVESHCDASAPVLRGDGQGGVQQWEAAERHTQHMRC